MSRGICKHGTLIDNNGINFCGECATKAGVLLGDKHDQGKVSWQYLPWSEVEDVAKVTDFGAKKYSPENWKRVPNARDRYFSAAMRHMTAWKAGEVLDSETQLPHLAHAVCCLLFIMWFDKKEKK